MKNIVLNLNDINTAADLWLSGTQLTVVNSILYKALVPVTGKAPTTAGETLRKANRTVYRFLNDGDICPKWRSDCVDCLTDKEQIAYFWNFMYKAIKKVANSRVGRTALEDAEVTVQFEC